MHDGRPVLSLAELESFDPRARQGGLEQRFCCPLCGVEKPRNEAHRSITVRKHDGVWTCHRCEAAGRLREFWERPVPLSRRERSRAELRRAFGLPVAPRAPAQPAVEPAPSAPANAWRKQLKRCQYLAGTAGEAYLAGRGIPLDLAHAARVRFSPDFYGRAAVVFPLYSRDGELVGAQGRHLYPRDGEPKAHDAGRKKQGAFGTPGAWNADPLVLVEAPIDALSLAACGFPAIALLGCDLADWAAWACALKSVVIATDADKGGDEAAQRWAAVLDNRGATWTRLRPPDGAKDWNEALQAQGAEALRAFLCRALETPAAGASCTEEGAPVSAAMAAVAPPPPVPTDADAAYDTALGEIAQALPDDDLLDWLKTHFGAGLYVDENGVLRAENAGAVPAEVRREVRSRQASLVQLLGVGSAPLAAGGPPHSAPGEPDPLFEVPPEGRRAVSPALPSAPCPPPPAPPIAPDIPRICACCGYTGDELRLVGCKWFCVDMGLCALRALGRA